MSSGNQILFTVLPYVAVVLAVVVSVSRFLRNRYSYSSLSSQFLENGTLFPGSLSFHYGLLVVLAGHLIGLLFPRQMMTFNIVPTRLFILESTSLAFALLTLVGLVLLIVRRGTSARVRAVTSRWDVVLLALLLVQVATGIHTAIFYRWGSAWYVHTAVPYLWSLVRLDPRPQLVAGLPLIVRLHMISAFVLIGVIPFTRLVHFLVVPIPYLWRPYQVVAWRRRLAGR
ncbi:MAG: respiratory nitrate reductase subunit gamma [Gemmatimonadota bacterium]